MVEVNDHNKESYTFEISTLNLFENTLLFKELATNNLVVPAWVGMELSIYITNCYKECKAKGFIEYTHEQLGWYDYNGDSLFLMDENVVGKTKSVSTRTNLKFSAGSEKDYREFLKKVIYPCDTLSLAMALGYSAVVSSRLNPLTNTGTILVNLCGASSTGKTTVEQLMVSPFGDPKISNQGGLIRTFSSTVNARFAGLEGINGIPMVLDDATTASYLDTSNLIYTIASGEGKSRCNSDGKLRNDGLGWSGTVIISSETPIQEDTKQNQGLQVRVLQTQGITWTPDAKTADLIKRTVQSNFGFTGKEFAEYVRTIPMDCLFKIYSKKLNLVNSLMVNRDNLTDRLASKYTIIYLTISLMNGCFNPKLDENKLIKILLKPEQDSVNERDIALKALNVIINFIEEKKSHFEIESFDNRGRENHPSSDKYGEIMISSDSKWYVYIPVQKTDEILRSKGINEFRTVRKRWAEKGFTKTDSDHNSVKKTVDSVSRRCDCFIFPKGIADDSHGDIEEIAGQPKEEPAKKEETPVSDCYYDDTKEVNEIFKQKGEENDN